MHCELAFAFHHIKGVAEMAHGVEEAFKVKVYYIYVTLVDYPLRSTKCVMASSSRTEAVARLGELVLIDGSQYLVYGLLHQTVYYCRYSWSNGTSTMLSSHIHMKVCTPPYHSVSDLSLWRQPLTWDNVFCILSFIRCVSITIV